MSELRTFDYPGCLEIQSKLAQKLGLRDLQVDRISPMGRIIYMRWITFDNQIYNVKIDLFRNFKKNDWFSMSLALKTRKNVIFTEQELIDIQDMFFELLRSFDNE
jgi:hypothetical protein